MANTRRFITEAVIDTQPRTALEGAAPAVTNTIDVKNLPDALVTGTTLLDLSQVQNPEVRSGISLSMLFASRVANAKKPTDEDEWLAAYTQALTDLGFSLAGSAVLKSRFKKLDVAVHKAIIPFLTLAFGGAAVGPVILALLSNLQSMNDSPWITLYDEQSRRFNVREMHFGAAIPNGSQTQIRYAVARLDVKLSGVQVLFFKIDSSHADFESVTTTMSVDNNLMASSEADLQKRLSALVKSYIWDAKI